MRAWPRRVVQAIGKGAVEYEHFYKPDLDERKARRLAEEEARKAADLACIAQDIADGTPRPEDVEVSARRTRAEPPSDAL